MPRLFRIVFLLGGLTAMMPDVRAAVTRPRIAIVSSEICCAEQFWSEAEVQIRNEFLQKGFEVFRQDESDAFLFAPEPILEAAVLQSGSVAAIGVLRHRAAGYAEILMWLKEPETGNTAFRRLEIDVTDDNTAESADVAALKTAELYRQTFQDLRNARIPPTRESEPETPTPPPSLETAPAFDIAIGFAGIFFIGDAPAAAAPCLSVAWRPFPSFFVALHGAFAFISPGIERGPHSAETAIHQIYLQSGWQFRSHRRLMPHVGVFGGVSLIQLSGQSPFEPVFDERTISGIFGVTSGLTVMISERLFISGHADVGVQLPGIEVHIADETAATFEWLFFRTTLFVGLRFGG